MDGGDDPAGEDVDEAKDGAAQGVTAGEAAPPVRVVGAQELEQFSIRHTKKCFSPHGI